jgi:hypothetical protein
LIQRRDDAIKARALAAQFLCLDRIIPDFGVFQLPAYFFEPVPLLSVVKDTP